MDALLPKNKECFFNLRIFWYLLKDANLHNLFTPEYRNKAPKRKRQREIALKHEMRIVAIWKKYIRYGKEKLALIYQKLYQEKISSWRIQKIIEKIQALLSSSKIAKIVKKRQKALSSLNAKGFLERLYYLFVGKIENLQTDNGPEFL